MSSFSANPGTSVNVYVGDSPTDSNSTDVYVGPGMNGSENTEANAGIVMPRRGKISKLTMHVMLNTMTLQTRVWEIMKNGAPTGQMLSIAPGVSTPQQQDVSVIFEQGDRISIHKYGTGPAGAGQFWGRGSTTIEWA